MKTNMNMETDKENEMVVDKNYKIHDGGYESKLADIESKIATGIIIGGIATVVLGVSYTNHAQAKENTFQPLKEYAGASAEVMTGDGFFITHTQSKDGENFFLYETGTADPVKTAQILQDMLKGGDITDEFKHGSFFSHYSEEIITRNTDIHFEEGKARYDFEGQASLNHDELYKHETAYVEGMIKAEDIQIRFNDNGVMVDNGAGILALSSGEIDSITRGNFPYADRMTILTPGDKDFSDTSFTHLGGKVDVYSEGASVVLDETGYRPVESDFTR